MIANLFHRLDTTDKYVLWSIAGLIGFGVVAVYSATSYLAHTQLGGDTEAFLLKHVTRAAMAFGAVLVFSLIDYHRLAKLSRIGLILAMGLLVAVQVVGVASGGATRWLNLGGVGFQPSDVARVALILYVSVLLTRKQAYIKSLSRSFIPLFCWVLGAVLLIGIEDLSTAAVVLMATVLMCFIGRVSVLQLSSLGLIALALAVLMLMMSPARAQRVESFKIFPHTEEVETMSSQHEGYQADQARIAVAMGGLTGVGPGKSVQRDFLPAPYNDFIFAIIAEEYGLFGALLLLGLLAVLLFRGFLRIARYAPDPLGLFLGVGLTTMLVLYGFIHAGVSVGLLPVTGLPLPFVSYGGTSMLAGGVMVGILLNISSQSVVTAKG